MAVTTTVQSEWMSHIEGRPIPDGEHVHVLSTARGPVVFFINKLNRHLVVLKPSRGGGQEVLDLSKLWKLTGQVSCLATTQSSDGGVHLYFAKESTQEGLLGKLFAIVPILPQDFDDDVKWRNALREFTPLIFLSGNAIVESITLSSLDGISSTATVILKVDDSWKAVNLNFEDVKDNITADEERGNGRTSNISKDDEPAESHSAEYLKDTQEPVKMPKLVGIKIDFAKYADLEVVPRIIPGNFGTQSGLFYFFSSKRTIKFGFRQDSGISRWFEAPAEAVNSMQAVSSGGLAGVIFVGTSKGLLMYSELSSTPDEPKKQDDMTSQGNESLGDQTALAMRSHQDSNKVDEEPKKVDSAAGKKEDEKGEKGDPGDRREKEPDKIKPTMLHEGPVSHLRLARTPSGSITTVWMLFGTNFGTLGYFEYKKFLGSNKSTAQFKLVPIIEAKISSFSGTLSIDGSSESILYQTQRGSNLLERSLSGSWSETIFEIPAPTIVKMAPAYISHIKFNSSDLPALHDSRFQLTCTSSITILVNEAPLLIDENPQIVALGPHANIEIVNLTDGLQTPNFVLQNAPGTSILPEPLILDPAHRVKERMRKTTSPSELKELAIGKENRAVFPDATDFEKLSGVLKDMYEHMDSLPADGTRKKDIKPLDDKDTESWGIFHLVESAIDSVQDFAVQGGHLVITVAGKIIGFVIDCFETALKGLSTIFAAAGAVVEDLQHWLGYIFDWEDIITTHTSLTTVFNFVVSVPDRMIEHAYSAIDDSLSKISHKLLSNIDPNESMKAASSDQQNLGKVQSGKSDREQQISKLSHPAIDYILNKLSNLLLGTMIQFKLDVDSETLTSIRKVFDANSELLKQLEKLGGEIVHGKHVNLLQLSEMIGEAALVVLINGLRGLLASFKKALQSILQALKDVSNKARNIPLLSALYKFGTGSSQDPSLLQMASLILAIPVSISCKVLKGTNFPIFTDENLASLATPSGSLEPNAQASVNHLVSLYKSAVRNLGIWTKEQPRTLGWIDLVHTTIITIDIACHGIPDLGLRDITPEEPGVVNVNNVTVVKTILQSFAILASMPMIQPDRFGTTTVPELRFQAWGIDSGLRLLEMVTSWKAVTDGTMEICNKSLLIIRNTLSMIMWSKIAAAEYEDRLPGMTDEDFSKAQTLAMWTIPESLAIYASHIAPAAVSKVAPENVRGLVALTSFGLGVAGNASRWARYEYHGESGQSFSPGLI